MVMNVRKPGFQLLSLVSHVSPSDPNPGSQQHLPCALPDQLGIYIWGYGLLALLSVIGVLVKRIRGYRRSRYDRSPTKEERAEAGEAVGMVRGRGSGIIGKPSNGHYVSESVIFEEAPRSARRRRGYTFALGSNLVGIPSLGSRSCRYGLVGGVLRDVRQVAWPPALIWIGITLWMFRWLD